MDGVIAGVVATCARDGTPNVSFLSQVEFVDSEHVALSFQFFNKTHQNVLANPFASVCITDPLTGASHTLHLEYLRTETSGPVFVRMKARLAGVASHEGMTGIFRLRGSDIYRVLEVESVPGTHLAAPESRDFLTGLRAYAAHVTQCHELDELIETTLADIETFFGIGHAMILVVDESADKLFTLASHGYESSGAGAEIPFGQGVIGMAAAESCAIRICFTAPEYGYGRAIRASAEHSELAERLETAIPFPGLADPQSQVAVPILSGQRLIGVLYADSDQEMRFGYEDEDALAIIAAQLGSAIAALTAGSHGEAESVAEPLQRVAKSGATTIHVRHFAENDSIFIDDDYLIKGVPGAILWALLTDYARLGRTAFSNRELRLDARLRLPEINDNLEARLVLLKRRLIDRNVPIRLVRTGRGRFGLSVAGAVELEEIAQPDRR
jgi:adenylate cyclase